jgi:hypothetical protein
MRARLEKKERSGAGGSRWQELPYLSIDWRHSQGRLIQFTAITGKTLGKVLATVSDHVKLFNSFHDDGKTNSRLQSSHHLSSHVAKKKGSALQLGLPSRCDRWRLSGANFEGSVTDLPQRSPGQNFTHPTEFMQPCHKPVACLSSR